MAKSHNNITTNTVSKFKLTEGRLVTFGLVGMVAAFGIVLVLFLKLNQIKNNMQKGKKYRSIFISATKLVNKF